ncbi:hypothetical protein BC829DRAFT_401416 [Chytridium lagenaria]|nr:hypothetical protein BC829DRAFT_401416 [Chytridium lagenaria]
MLRFRRTGIRALSTCKRALRRQYLSSIKTWPCSQYEPLEPHAMGNVRQLQAEAIPSEPSFVDLLQMDAATLFEELGSVPPAPFATGTSDKSEQDTSSSPLPSSSTKSITQGSCPYSFFLAWTKEEKKKNKRKFDKSAYDMWKEMTEAEKEVGRIILVLFVVLNMAMSVFSFLF